MLRLALISLHAGHPNDVAALCWFYGVPHPVRGAAAEKVGASEIARRLGKDVGAIHQILSRGRARLRETLAAQVTDSISTLADLEPETRLVLEPLGGRYPGMIAAPHRESSSAG